ncbi:MAG: ubiquinol-cytochrome c reductase iron-sulfur subunit [Gemmatimonadales bacterium]
MSERMLRRDFIVLGVAAVSLGGCAGARYVVPRVGEGRLVVPLAEIEQEGEAFLRAPEMQRPVYVRRLESGELSAVLASCTHQGCQPDPIGDRLVCPCHGSEFAFDGRVLQGPAERPLPRYDVTIEGDDLVVWLERGTRP